MDKRGFFADQKTKSAVERELLTISEACRAIHALEEAQGIAPKDRLETRYPRVPWREIRGIGNILRHEYGRVDLEVVWSTIGSDDLSRLEKALAEAFPTAQPLDKP